MRAALAARVPYTDLGGLYHGTREAVRARRRLPRGGRAGAPRDGLDPRHHQRHGRGPRPPVRRGRERSTCAWDASTGSAIGPLPVPYALDTVIDEFSLDPMVFRDGRAEAVRARSGEEKIAFPQPVGQVRAFYTLALRGRDVPALVPGLRTRASRSRSSRSSRARCGSWSSSDSHRARSSSGGASPREVLLALAARQPVPRGRADDSDVLRVDVTGRRGGQAARRARAEMTVLPHPAWKMAAGSLDTGVPLSIVAQMLASPRDLAAGRALPRDGRAARAVLRGAHAARHGGTLRSGMSATGEEIREHRIDQPGDRRPPRALRAARRPTRSSGRVAAADRLPPLARRLRSPSARRS